MRDEWYGDKRDLLKWAALMQLASIHKVQRVLQIAYLQPTAYPKIQIDKKSYPIPKSVITHFRDLTKIKSIGGDVSVSLLDVPFNDREAYLKQALGFIRKHQSERSIVFLDPDVGLEPQENPDFRHVLGSEAKAIWDAMKRGDVFACFQYKTNYAGRPWKEPKRKQLERSLLVGEEAVKMVEAPDLDRDAVIFFARK